MNRRQALLWGVGTVSALGSLSSQLLPKLSTQIYLQSNASRSFPVSSYKPLAERAAAKGILYGAACRQDHLKTNPHYAEAIVRECKILVPEWELKWSASYPPLRPSPTMFDFTLTDWMSAFAKTNKIFFRGHTLVWHMSLPTWFSETVTAQNAENHLTTHIQTVMKRYAGQVHSWDVVNEAIEVEDGRSDGLRKTPWLGFLGSNYIDLAFRIAAKADPKAMLVYNDYGLEYDTPEDDAKRNAVLKLLENLKAKGTPIHAFGLQGHLGAHAPFSEEKLKRFLSQVANLGLKILVTELDVTDSKLASPINVRDHLVASVYEDFLSTVLDERAVIAVLTWGLSDRYSWLSESKSGNETIVRGLPLDINLERKLAWNAIARAFDNAPKR